MKSNTASEKVKLILSMFLFGTLGVFVKYISLPSAVTALVRAVVGSAFLLVFTAVTKKKISASSIKRNFVLLFISGALIGFNWILLFEAYNYTTVAAATLCYYLAPIFVIIASPLVLKERLTLKKVLCTLTALAGMVLVSGVLTLGAGGSELKGAALGTGAAILYASIILINKKLSGISAYDRTIVQLTVSAVVLAPYVFLTESMGDIKITPVSVLLLLTVGILHTGIAYALYFGAVASLNAQTVAIMSYIDPLVAVILSATLLGEKTDIYGITGAVMILAATAVSEISADYFKKKAQKH